MFEKALEFFLKWGEVYIIINTALIVAGIIIFFVIVLKDLKESKEQGKR